MTVFLENSYFYLCKGSVYAYKYTSFGDRLYYDYTRLDYIKRSA